VNALRALGGSGSIEEINAKVVELMKLPDAVLEVPHLDGTTSEVAYRLAWSRTYLKIFGLVENSSRGVWSLTPKGSTITEVDPKQIVAYARRMRSSRKLPKGPEEGNGALVGEDSVPTWQEQYLQKLHGLSPNAFERLVKRMLRESGFTHVEVTGRSGDGGVDGIGIAKISGFLSFRVLFQCKKYRGAVTPSEIRDFRGAMQGRTDKGLFATTGSFTQNAIKEATRDGAPPIDLLDGNQLVERLKDLGLGVKITMVEAVEIDETWLDSF
jgi:restriction system protein